MDSTAKPLSYEQAYFLKTRRMQSLLAGDSLHTDYAILSWNKDNLM